MSEEILVLRLSSLGDVVLASSFLQSLADHFQRPRVTFVVRDDLAELAAALPEVNRVVAVRRDLGVAGLVALAGELAREPYAHAFDLHRSLRSRLLCHRLRGRLRPGFYKQEFARWMLVHQHRDVYARCGGAQPLRQRMLAPLGRMGLAPRLHDTRLVLHPAVRSRADVALRDAGVQPGETLVGLAPGARWPSKCWGLERYAALASRLAQGPGRRLLVFGGERERALGGLVAFAAPGRAVNLSGTLGLLETAAALARCALLLTNDSGLAHVAEAVGTPVVALFGPTSPRFGYAPYRPASRLLQVPPTCSPCSKNGSRPCTRPTHECMEAISVEAVHAAAVEVLVAP